MGKGRQGMGIRAALLAGILMLDGALLGTTAGIWNCTREVGGGTYRAVHQAAARGRFISEPVTKELAETDRQKEPKGVALTFDDGPHAVHTKALLDGLKERGVKVTFFLMGQSIEGNEELVERMKMEGHLIGNHSYRHVQLTKAGEDAVEETELMIEKITGARPQYLRPPYGDWNENLECRLDLTTVFWSVDSLDWKLQDVGKIVENVEKKVKSGDIVLMHDIFPTSVEAALQLVDHLSRQGYQFVTVEELLID